MFCWCSVACRTQINPNWSKCVSVLCAKENSLVVPMGLVLAMKQEGLSAWKLLEDFFSSSKKCTGKKNLFSSGKKVSRRACNPLWLTTREVANISLLAEQRDGGIKSLILGSNCWIKSKELPCIQISYYHSKTCLWRATQMVFWHQNLIIGLLPL